MQQQQIEQKTSMKRIKQIYFFTGAASLIHFVITGILLRINFFSVDHSDVSGRMMFRANHIYILLCGLQNLLLHFTISPAQKQNGFIFLSFTLTVVATLGLNISFYFDPISHLLQRNLTKLSIIGLFSGIVLHLLCLQFSRHSTGN